VQPRELTEALLVNPYAIDDSARTLADGLVMVDEEQSRRMRAMRSIVARFNAYRWAGEMLRDAVRVRSRLTAPSRDLRDDWGSAVVPA
jgi:trehalose 6-phosphate synthase